MREHQSVYTVCCWHQNIYIAMGLVYTDTWDKRCSLETESYSIAIQVVIQWHLHQLQAVFGSSPVGRPII